MVTWDDHEVANDTYNLGAENHSPDTEGDYIARRDAAIQAYLEWLPVRATTFSEGGHLYRSFQYGTLADITMLDLRTYRDKAPEFVNIGDTDDQGRTMLGSEQMNFLHNQWSTSSATWNLVGNSVMFTPVLIPPLDPQTSGAITELLGLPQDGVPYNSDQWDGYAHERRRRDRVHLRQRVEHRRHREAAAAQRHLPDRRAGAHGRQPLRQVDRIRPPRLRQRAGPRRRDHRRVPLRRGQDHPRPAAVHAGRLPREARRGRLPGVSPDPPLESPRAPDVFVKTSGAFSHALRRHFPHDDESPMWRHIIVFPDNLHDEVHHH